MAISKPFDKAETQAEAALNDRSADNIIGLDSKRFKPHPNFKRAKFGPFRPILAQTIVKRPPEWLWWMRIAKGGVNLLTADPEAGKSTLVCEIVAAFTTGRPLPGDNPEKPRELATVLILSAEDQADTTIMWRLDNQGADTSRIYIDDRRRCSLNTDTLSDLREMIRCLGITFCVIDTLTSWAGADFDMNSGSRAAEWLGELNNIARDTGCTFLVLRHNRKAGGNAITKGLGSLAFTGTVRCELSLEVKKNKHTGELDRLLSVSKKNIGKPQRKLAYTLEDVEGEPDNQHGRLVWLDDLPFDEPPPQGPTKPSTVKKVRKVIEHLIPGPLSYSDWFKRSGLTSDTTFDRYRKQAADDGVVEQRDGLWHLVEPNAYLPGFVPKLPLARQILREALADGPKPFDELMKLAGERKITERTLRRATDGIAQPVQLGDGSWVWTLLRKTPTTALA